MCIRDRLSTRAYSISGVAEELGYSGVYAFSKAFKAYYKMPPSELFKMCIRDRAWVATSAYFVGMAAIIISGIMLKKTKICLLYTSRCV